MCDQQSLRSHAAAHSVGMQIRFGRFVGATLVASSCFLFKSPPLNEYRVLHNAYTIYNIYIFYDN